MKTLRFAPIIRVSTEKQEKQGESLRTQTTQIKQYVQSLNGTIPEHCWTYTGQEHATPDMERTKLNQLLKDSAKDLFDAVIVCDASRWSRDNFKSKEGLNILRTNKIRFFVGTTEFDLYNPGQNLFLGMSAEIGEYQAREQSLKSIVNRIERAKRGIPTAGKMPFGRTYDEITGWGIDPEKQRMIQNAATRYLSGEGLTEIARSYGINASNLHKILTKRSGTSWECRFRNKRLNIDKTVKMKISPLLNQKTIDAIQERMRNNITYVRGHRKYKYLLSGMVYCKRCGYSMASYRNHSGKQYYRHSKNGDGSCSFHKLVPAVELENSVLIQLVQTFGDREKIETAIQKATPDLKKREALSKEQDELNKELKKIITQKEKIVEMVAEGALSTGEVKNKMEKLRESENSINNRLVIIESELSGIPDPKQIKKSSYWAGKVLAVATKRPQTVFKRDFAWKRRLIERAFGGVNNTGARLGVYVDYNKGGFTFEIRGLFENTVKALPLSDDDLIFAFKLDSEYQDIDKELEDIKSNIQGKCNAYYSKCIY